MSNQTVKIPVQPEVLPVATVLSIRDLRHILKVAKESSKASTAHPGVVRSSHTIVMRGKVALSGAYLGLQASSSIRLSNPHTGGEVRL